MNIFITGGTTGIGLALTKYYLNQGHVVGICGRNINKFYDVFPHIPPNVFFYEVDVVNREGLQDAIEDFSRKNAHSGNGGNGKLDLVIANAGMGLPSKTIFPDFVVAREMIDVNILGVMNTLEVAMKLMGSDGCSASGSGSGSGGHLVVIASVAGFVGLPRTGMYSATKAFLLKLFESYAIDLKQHGFTFTAIAPGFVDTPLTRANKHPMPFLMSADKAAVLISKAIEKKKELYIFPWQMKVLILSFYHLPRFIYRGLMRAYFNIFRPGYFS
ncbi:MAG: SDR family NAD(P)-dependent oxidoreductase [Oligoflexia bacterium]|nr:SDR family NAD(P)-dependent oxidoreductase [Oligoflexia bacterium]